MLYSLLKFCYLRQIDIISNYASALIHCIDVEGADHTTWWTTKFTSLKAI